MKARLASLISLSLLALHPGGGLAEEPAPAPAPPAPVAPPAGATFSYAQGGAEWDGLCARSFPQSPIDIALPEGEGGLDSKALRFHYPPAYPWQSGIALRHDGARVVLARGAGNDTALAVGTDEGLGYMIRDGVKYPVVRVEFHAPSEHTVRGQRFDMEMQIVHQRQGSAGTDNLVVVAALFSAPSEKEPANKWLQDALMWDHLPASPGERRDLTAPIQLGSGVAGLHSGYYRYAGSLTAPPCAAQVEWNVMETVQYMSFAQKFAISQLFAGNPRFARTHGNNRDTQPLMSRAVTLHNHHQRGDGDGRAPASPGPEQAAPEAGVSAPRWDKGGAPPEAVNRTQEELDRQADEARPATQPELYRLHGRDWAGACRTGREQSPIDIRLETGNPHGDFEASFTYREVPVTSVAHKGFALVVDPTRSPGVLATGGLEYSLFRVQFHTPAEHLVDGRRADMEMQLVHRRALKADIDGRTHDYAVLSVLFRNGGFTENALLKQLGERLPTAAGSSSPLGGALFNLNAVNGLGEGYYSYAGSLSAPPCTEGVRRFVLRTVQDMSQIQLNTWRAAVSGNYRDVQPRNYRGVVVHNVNDHIDIVPPTRPLASSSSFKAALQP